MNILVIGSGGREHALAAAYAKSKRVKRVFVAPGNALMDYKNAKISILPSIRVLDFDAIKDFVKKEKIDVVDVAQDDPLAAGFVDKLEALGVAAFGPTQKAAQIEWSKEWARNFMIKYKLPIPRFKSFTNPDAALAYIHSLPEEVVYVKASGLALGKGAIRAEDKKAAIEAVELMSQFGKAGETFLIEEALVGEEFSLFAICDGKDYQIVGWAQDHKTIYEADQGPNTGGIGSVAPAGVLDSSMMYIIEVKILKPFMEGMRKEGRPYKGILYLGGMLTHSASSGQAKDGVKIVEFNARWGDPEAEVILPGIQTDYMDIVEAVMQGRLSFRAKSRNLIHPKAVERDPSTRPSALVGMTRVKTDRKVRISVAGCSRGYPGDYSAVKGKEIFGLMQAMKLPGITIFGAGIERRDNRFFANGGRVFHLVAEGETIVQARVRAYGAMAMISIEGNNLHYRTDIGWRDAARFTKMSF